MVYIFIAAVALLAIAYIVYRILDLLARRKFAQSYVNWEPDLGQYYRKHSPYVRVASCPADRESRETADRICERLNELHETMSGGRG